MINIDELRKMVDWQTGRIGCGLHFDGEVYRTEAERVFNRAWLVVGHEEMVPKTGDYITNYMGEVLVIVVRDSSDGISVLVNKCPHRGNQVCTFDRGNTNAFTCSYHGWSFDLDGTLIGAPQEKELYGDRLDKSEWGIERAPQIRNLHGLLFASFDPQAPALEDWLGEDTIWWLENFVLAAPFGGLEMLPGIHKNRTPGNWKVVAENFIGDNYHFFAATHVSYFAAAQAFAAKGISIPIMTYPDVTQVERPLLEGSGGSGEVAPFGFGLVSVGDDSIYKRDLAEAQELGKEAVEWVEFRRARLEEVLNDRPAIPYGFMNGLLFPNFGLMGFFSPMIGRHFHLFHPRGPLEHESWQWTMVEKQAPQAVKDLAVQRVYQGQHMAGLLAPDDSENFQRVTEASQPERNWHRPNYYGLQIGNEEDGPEGLPGRLGPNPSEANQRAFYRFWLEMMEAE